MHGVIHRHHELKLRCKIAQGASWPSWFVTRLPMLYGSRYNVSIDNAVYKPAYKYGAPCGFSSNKWRSVSKKCTAGETL